MDPQVPLNNWFLALSASAAPGGVIPNCNKTTVRGKSMIARQSPNHCFRSYAWELLHCLVFTEGQLCQLNLRKKKIIN